MTPLRRSHRPAEQGFTLVFTILLVAIVTVLAGTVITRVLVSNRAVVREQSDQNDSDLALTALNMAFDEISRDTDLMVNTVWTGVVESKEAEYPVNGVVPPRNRSFPAIVATGSTATGANIFSADMGAGVTQKYHMLETTPLRDLGLLGNIRHWPAFADWSKWPTTAAAFSDLPDAPTKQAWSRGWEYLPNDTTKITYEMYNKGAGINTGLTNGSRVKVMSVDTDGDYWYKQTSPSPPDSSTTCPAPDGWRNKSREYPKGLFYQPVLWKVYTLGNNRRAAVFVRMSLHDYFGPDPANPDDTTKVRNMAIDGKTIFSDRNSTPGNNSFDGSNFEDRSQAITFSVFSVGEGRVLSTSGTTVTRAQARRYHQALNVGVGPCEYNSGTAPADGNYSVYNSRKRSLPLYSNSSVTADGTANRPLLQYIATPSVPQKHYDRTSRTGTLPWESKLPAEELAHERVFRAPYFAPTFKTSGVGKLIMHQPIRGVVFPASLDLTDNGYTSPSNPAFTSNARNVIFLYEIVEFAGGSQVVFLIERIQGTPDATPKWRRRLLRDDRVKVPNKVLHYATNPELVEPIYFDMVNYHTATLNPWDPGATSTANEKLYPSLLFYANKPFIRREDSPDSQYATRSVSTIATSQDPKWKFELRGDAYPGATAVASVGFTIGESAAVGGTDTYQSKGVSLWQIVKNFRDASDNPSFRYVEDHWATDSFDPANVTVGNGAFTSGSYNQMCYPHSAPCTKTFEIGKEGETGWGISKNVVNWPNNPLLSSPATSDDNTASTLPDDMPWQGPTKARVGSGATVYYVASTFPQYAYSDFWGIAFSGGGISLKMEAKMEAVNGQ